jgi:hypothetical protein
MKKSVMWIFVFLFLTTAAFASRFPTASAIFEYRKGTCLENGTMLLNLTHDGVTIKLSDINMTIEGDYMPRMPLRGSWYQGRYRVENYTGRSMMGDMQRFTFITDNTYRAPGKYIIKMHWPSRSIYQNNIMFAVECPGMPCASNNNCLSEQFCSNQTKKCEWSRCGQNDFAVGHTCLPRCNDYDKCTEDHFVDGKCANVKIENCEASGQMFVKYGFFRRLWNWISRR